METDAAPDVRLVLPIGKEDCVAPEYLQHLLVTLVRMDLQREGRQSRSRSRSPTPGRSEVDTLEKLNLLSASPECRHCPHGARQPEASFRQSSKEFSMSLKNL